MGKADATLALGKLVSAFRQDGIREDTVETYVDRLQDIDPQLLEATVNQIIDRSKFFPSVSEIRELAGRIAGVLPPLAAEAMALIRAADRRESVFRRDGSFAYEERFWEWPEMTPVTRQAVEAALAKAGEPCDPDGKARFGWETGFQKIYEAEATEVSVRPLADLSRARLPAGRGEDTRLIGEGAAR